jgi:hypothetical protein
MGNTGHNGLDPTALRSGGELADMEQSHRYGCYEYGSEPWVSIDDPVAPAIEITNISAYPNPLVQVTNIRVICKQIPIRVS